MQGPQANLPNKTRAIEEEWEALKDPAGAVYYRSILTGKTYVRTGPAACMCFSCWVKLASNRWKS